MHLLVLLAQEHWTGPAEGVLQLARGLRERGHRVTFVFTRLPAGHLAEHVDGAFATAPAVRLPRKGFHPLIATADWFRLRRFVRRENVGAIFCHLSHDHWLALALAWGMTPRPAVVRQIHQSRHLVRRADLAWLYRRTDALVVGANQWKAKLVENFGLDPAKVIVIPPGVDTDRFKPDGDVEVIRREIGAQPGDKLIGMVSRIKASRGHELALQAFQHVRAKQPRAHLLFVGRGEGREALEREVARLDLASSVHFLGYRADDLPAIYRALDVHLLLGEGSDGSCRAALEAMACGAPVVALRVGTLTESLAEGCTGFFADPSADDLAAKILHVLEQPLARETIRAHAVANFSIAPRVDLAENLFMRLTDRR